MTAAVASLRGFWAALRSDLMLFWVLPVPLLAAAALRLLLPLAEGWITAYFQAGAVLAPYYLISDLLVAVVAPVLLAYVSVMVVLEERDDGLTRYLAVTPLGRGGYLLTRVFVPVLLGAAYTVPLLACLSLTRPAPWLILPLALSGGLSGAISALLVPAFAGNKVEGMALVKLSTLVLTGLFLPFFLDGPLQYAAAFLPSFWMARLALDGQVFWLLPTALTGLGWLWLLCRRFARKLI